MKMKILIVKKKDSCWPFVEEQVNALMALNTGGADDLVFSWHLIEGKGLLSYLHDAVKLIKNIREIRPDIIHAHYGMSGFYTCMVVRLMGLAQKMPVVITYHGSDINLPKVRRLSQRAIRMADYNIFVSPKMVEQVEAEKYQVIPCGINWDEWRVMGKAEARKAMQMNPEKKYILFSSDFQTEVKNPELAKQAVAKLNNVELIELRGYTRAEVNKLMHAVDVCLMTSKTEGSPQFIKEAMVCGCPIVTTRVGDAEYVIGDTEGCYFTCYDAWNCAEQLNKAFRYAEQYDRTNGRERIARLGYGNDIIARKIKDIYNFVKRK